MNDHEQSLMSQASALMSMCRIAETMGFLEQARVYRKEALLLLERITISFKKPSEA